MLSGVQRSRSMPAERHSSAMTASFDSIRHTTPDSAQDASLAPTDVYLTHYSIFQPINAAAPAADRSAVADETWLWQSASRWVLR
jgi:hypothetical protein